MLRSGQLTKQEFLETHARAAVAQRGLPDEDVHPPLRVARKALIRNVVQSNHCAKIRVRARACAEI